MKVVLISFLGRGGMLHYTSQLANALSEKNKIAVVLPSFSETHYFNKNTSIIKIQAPADILKTCIHSLNFFALRRLLLMIRKNDPDVIHFVNSHPWNVIICFVFKDVKKVFTLHDPLPHEERISTRIIQPILSFCDQYLINQVNTIIVHGKILKNICISRNIPSRKIEVIPLGDILFFNKNDVGPCINPSRFMKNILFFGRIEPYKGLDYFLQAANRIINTIPNISITIAGDGNLSPYEHQLPKTSNFTVINRYIFDDEVYSLFNNTDVVVLPYISASQSGIIPIAYAFKKPVIATHVGAIPEVIDDGVTGILIPPRDVDALVAAITKLLSDDDLRTRMGVNAFNKMRSDLSWQEIAKRHMEIYQRDLIY